MAKTKKISFESMKQKLIYNENISENDGYASNISFYACDTAMYLFNSIILSFCCAEVKPS